MGLDGEVLHAGVIGEDERHDGPEPAAPPLLVEEMGDGAGAGRLAGQRGVDGRGQGRRAMLVEQVAEPAELRDAAIAVGRPLREEPVQRGDGLSQPLSGGDWAGGALLGGQCGDMGGILDDHAGVVAARVAGDLGRAIDDAHGGRVGQQRDGALHARVGNRIAIAIEADVGLLAAADRAHQRRLEGMGRLGQQHALLLSEDLRDGLIAVLGMAPLVRDRVAPRDKLRLEIVDIAKGARRDEGVPQILDLPLDLPLLVGARRRAGAWGEVIVAGQLKEPRVEVNGRALPVQHRGLQIVVDEGAGTAAEGAEGLDVSAEEALERLVQREDGVDRARVAEDEHEGGQGPRAATDPDRPKAAPVHLGDLARERRES